MSALDRIVLAELERLPAACADVEPARSTVYAQAAETARRLSISAAFVERLQSDLGALIGCSDGGRLTRAGRALAALHTVDCHWRSLALTINTG